MKRRGISPLISVVLLIAFTVTLFLLITNWIRGSIIEEATSATEEKLAGQLDCLSVEVEVSNVCVTTAGNKIKLNVDNTGDTNIKGLTIRVLNAAGALGTVEVTGKDTAPLGRVLSKSEEQTLSGAVTNANRVEVYPSVSSGLCRDQFDVVTNVEVKDTC